MPPVVKSQEDEDGLNTDKTETEKIGQAQIDQTQDETSTTGDSDDSEPTEVEDVEVDESMFSGRETADDIVDSDTPESDTDEDKTENKPLEETINEGCAALATIGLEDDKEDLEKDFIHIFEKFRLGHYGAECADEYVLSGADEEVDPLWGLMGSALLCAVIVVMQRPDTDDQLQNIQSIIQEETE